MDKACVIRGWGADRQELVLCIKSSKKPDASGKDESCPFMERAIKRPPTINTRKTVARRRLLFPAPVTFTSASSIGGLSLPVMDTQFFHSFNHDLDIFCLGALHASARRKYETTI